MAPGEGLKLIVSIETLGRLEEGIFTSNHLRTGRRVVNCERSLLSDGQSEAAKRREHAIKIDVAVPVLDVRCLDDIASVLVTAENQAEFNK